MAAVISGNSLGLNYSSLNLLGNYGPGGNANLGRTGEQVYVNATTGNLVIQGQDEYIASIGIDAALVRTYNSQGRYTDDNGDNWRLNIHQRLSEITAFPNTAGSTVIRIGRDGAEATYNFDSASGLYVSTDGAGPHDTLRYTGAQWEWTDGTVGITEVYNDAGQLIETQDQDGNTASYLYAGDLLTRIIDSSGQIVEFDYAGSNLTGIRTLSNTYIVKANESWAGIAIKLYGEVGLSDDLQALYGNQPLTEGLELNAVPVSLANASTGTSSSLLWNSRVRYGYDSLNRLAQVIVDLTPEDHFFTLLDSDSDSLFDTVNNQTYVTTYTYDDVSGLVDSITQGDGTTISFTYVDAGGQWRVATTTDGAGVVTTYTYEQAVPDEIFIVEANQALVQTSDTAVGANTVLNSNNLTTDANHTVINYDLDTTSPALSTTGTKTTDYLLNADALTEDVNLTGRVWEGISEFSSINGTYSKIAFDAMGNGIAVWSESIGWQPGTTYAKRYENGQWGEAQAIGGISNFDFETSSTGYAVATWIAQELVNGSYQQVLRINRFDPTLGGWQGSEIVQVSSTTISNRDIAVDENGNIALLWRQDINGYTNDHLNANYYLAGSGWQGAALLENSDVYITVSPRVEIDGAGRASAIWVQYDGVTNRRYESIFTIGQGWNASPSIFGGTSSSASQFDIVYDASGNGLAVWVDGNSAYASRYENGAWGVAERIDDPVNPYSQEFNIKLTIDRASGNAVAVWRDGVNIKMERFIPGQGWQGIETVTDGVAGRVYNDYFPSTAALDSRGNVAIASGYRYLNGSGVYVYGLDTNYYSVTNGWQGSETITSANGAGNIYDAEISFDASGNSLLFWRQYNGSTNSAYLSRNVPEARPYYSVQANDTWESIAQTFYGTTALAAQLATAIGNPSLVSGSRLTGLPASLQLTTAAVVNPYYVVQSGDSWTHIAELLYGTADVANELQAALGNPALTAGVQLTGLPATLLKPYTVYQVDNAQLSTTQTVTTHPEYAVNNAALIQDIPATPAMWGVPETFNQGGTPTEYAIQYDAAGNAIATWLQSSTLYVRHYQNGAWGAAQVLASYPPYPSYSNLAVDPSGYAVVTWRGYDPVANVHNLYASYYDPAQGVWQGPTLLENSPSIVVLSNRKSSISLDSQGNALVVWDQDTQGDGIIDIHASRYVAGQGWQAAVQLSDGSLGSAYNPNAFTAPNGDILVTFQQNYLTYVNRYVAGQGWQTAAMPFEPTTGMNVKSLNIRFDAAGNGLAVWIKIGSPTDDVYASRYENGLWSTSEQIDEASTSIGNINLAFDAASGRAAVIFYDVLGRLSVNRLEPSQGWQGSTQIGYDYNAYSSVIAISTQGDIITAWRHGSPYGQMDIQSNRYIAGQGWQGIEEYGAPATDTTHPQIAMDPNGNATVIWVGGYKLNSVQYTAPTPGSTPYYLVQANQNWADIATALYGTADVADELQQAMDPTGSIVLAQDLRWYAPPVALVDTKVESITIPAYYEVQDNDSWTHIAELLYGTTDVADELQAALGNPALTAGVQLTGLPATLLKPYTVYQVDNNQLSTTQTVTTHPEYAINNAALIQDIPATPAMWGVPETFNQGAATEYAIQYDAAGNAIANWVQGSTLYVRHYQNGVWGTAQVLATNVAMYPTRYSMVVDPSGRAVIAWRGNDANYVSSLYASYYDPTQGVWTSPALLEDSPNIVAFSKPAITLDDQGNALVVWEQDIQGDGIYDVHASRYVAGQGWQAATQLSDGALGNASNLNAFTAPNGDIWVTFQQNYLTYVNRYVAGQGWQASPTLFEPTSGATGSNVMNLFIRFDGARNGLAVWRNSANTVNIVYASRYENGVWSAPEEIGLANSFDIVNLAFDAASGRAAVSLRDVVSNVYVNRFEPGQGWQGVTRIGGAYNVSPVIAMSTQGDIVTAWKHYSSATGQYNILSNRYIVDQGWQGAEEYGVPATDTANPQIAMDPNGNATVIWVGGYKLNSIQYTAPTPGSTPYYLVQANQNWADIATALYGTADVADELQQALDPDNTLTLAAGLHLAGPPATLVDTKVEYFTVVSHYEIQAGDTWATIAATLYGSPLAGGQLSISLGNPPLTAGNWLTDLPATLTVDNEAGYQVTATDTWDTIANTLYGTTDVANELQAALDNPALIPGMLLRDLPTTLADAYQINVAGYHTVQLGDTWSSIANRYYGASDGDVIAALQTAVGTSALTLDAKLVIPSTLAITQSNIAATNVTRDGLTTSYVNDDQGRLARVISPSVNGTRLDTRYLYDNDGNLTKVFDANGHYTEIQYDDRGNLVLERDAQGNTITRTFSASNQVLTETRFRIADPDGNGIETAEDPLTSRYVYDSEGHLTYSVSAEGRVTQHIYNTAGQRITTVAYTAAAYDLSGLAPTDILDEIALAAWAASQNKSQTQRTDYSYDFRGQVATITQFAVVDAVTGEGLNTVENPASVTRFIYDQRGQLLETINPRGTATSTTGDYLTKYVYDGLGRVTSSTNANGITTVTQYDDIGNRIETTAANGLVTSSVFNARGGLVSVTQSDSANPELGTTAYRYDAHGRLHHTTDPTGITTYQLYDELGRQVASVDANGTLVESVYNNVGNIVLTIEYATAVNPSLLVDVNGEPTATMLADIRPASNIEDRINRYAYNNANQLVYRVDALGYVTENHYDGLGLLISTTEHADAIALTALPATPVAATAAQIATALQNRVQPSLQDDRITRQYYDADANLIGILNAEGYLTEYRYDAAGQLVETIAYATQVTQQGAEGVLPQVGSTVEDIHLYNIYDAKGQLTGKIDGEGYLTEDQYDVAGNLETVTRYSGKAQAYARGVSVADVRPLSQAFFPDGVIIIANQITRYTYTALNQLETETNAEGTVTRYTYDDVSNLVSTTKSLGGTEQNAARTVNQRFDNQGRLIGELTAEGESALVALGANPSQASIDAIYAQYGITHTYDIAGRRTSTTDQWGNSTYFYYNQDNQLRYSISANGEVKETQYNVFGQHEARISYARRIGDATTTTTVDDLVVLTGGLTNTLIDGLVAAIADPANDSKTQTNYTLRGAVKAAIDGENYRSEYLYNAFGEITETQQQITAPGSGATPLAAANSVSNTIFYNRLGQQRHATQDVGGLNITTHTEYDAFGRAWRSIDANGNVRTVQYDKLGRAVEMVDPNTPARTTSYDAFDRTLTQTDALGNATTYRYDEAARSMTILTPEGISTSTIRNRHGETVEIIDGNQNSTLYTYDLNGNLKTVTDAEGNVTENFYDNGIEHNRLHETKDANGNIIRYTYDTNNRVSQRTVDPNGLNIVTQYEYDAQGRTILTTEAFGTPEARITKTVYDHRGQVTESIVDPDGLNLVTHFTYDGRGETLTVTQGFNTEDAQTTQYIYDKAGRRTRQVVDPGAGHLNITTEYKYDDAGNVVAVIDAEGNISRSVYDETNDLVLSIDATGAVTENIYNDNGLIVKTIAYKDRLTASTLSSMSYQVTREDVESDSNIIASEKRVAEYYYDDDNRLRFNVNAEGGVLERRYDSSGNVVKTLAYAQLIDAAQLDPALHPSGADMFAVLAGMVESQETGPEPEEGRPQIVRTVFDKANYAQFSINALGYVTENIYDNVGNVVTTTKYGTKIDVSAIDAATDKLQNVVDQLGVSIQATQTRRDVYDNAGRKQYSVDAMGYVTTYTFYATGEIKDSTIHYVPVELAQLSKETNGAEIIAALGSRTLPTVAKNQTTRFNYDSAGRLTEQTKAVGSEIEYTEAYAYDNLGRITSNTNGNGDAEYTAYDAAGNVSRFIDAMGYVTDSTYYGTGELQTQTQYKNRTSLPENKYGLSEPGPYLVAAGDTWVSIATYLYGNADVADELRQALGYPDLVVGAELTGLPSFLPVSDPALWAYNAPDPVADYDSTYGDRLTTYSYDEVGRLERKSAPPIIENIGDVMLFESIVTHYQYDAFGNLINTVKAENRAEETVIHRVYDDLNRIIEEWQDYGGANQTQRRYEYDAFGNQSKFVNELNEHTDQVFDALNRKESVTDPENGTTETIYDAYNNVNKSIDTNGGVGYFYYDDNNRVILQIDPERYATELKYDVNGAVASTVRYSNKMEGYIDEHKKPLILDTTPENQITEAFLVKNQVSDQETHITNDVLGRKSVITDAMGYVESYSYDSLGNATSYTDKNGATFTYQYDAVSNKTVEGKPLLEEAAAFELSRGIKSQKQEGITNIETASDKEGNTIAVWGYRDPVTGYYDIASHRYNKLTGWDESISYMRISADVGAVYLKLVMDDEGNATVIWKKPDFKGLYVATLKAGTVVWETPWRLDPDTQTHPIYNENISIDSAGNMVVVWQQSDGVSTNIYSAFSQKLINSPLSVGWSDPELVESGLETAYEPEVAYNDAGIASVVWHQAGSVHLKEYNPQVGWSQESVINLGTANPSSTPVIATGKDGSIHIAWAAGGNAYTKKYVAGVGWTETVLLAEGAVSVSPKIVSTDTGNIHIFWKKYIQGLSEYYTAEYSVENGWTPPHKLSLPGWATLDSYEVAAGVNGSLVFAYHAINGTTAKVIAAVYTSDVGWHVPSALSSTGVGNEKFDISINSEGEISLVWVDEDKLGDEKTYAQRYMTGVNDKFTLDAWGNKTALIEADGRAEQRVAEYLYDKANNLRETILPQVLTPVEVAHDVPLVIEAFDNTDAFTAVYTHTRDYDAFRGSHLGKTETNTVSLSWVHPITGLGDGPIKIVWEAWDDATVGADSIKETAETILLDPMATSAELYLPDQDFPKWGSFEEFSAKNTITFYKQIGSEWVKVGGHTDSHQYWEKTYDTFDSDTGGVVTWVSNKGGMIFPAIMKLPEELLSVRTMELHMSASKYSPIDTQDIYVVPVREDGVVILFNDDGLFESSGGPSGNHYADLFDGEGNSLGRLNISISYVDSPYSARKVTAQYVSHTETILEQPHSYKYYDALGSLIKEIDANGNSQHMWYDKSGHQVAMVDAERYLHEYEYDAVGNLVRERIYTNAIPETIIRGQSEQVDFDTMTPSYFKEAANWDMRNYREKQYVYDGNGRLSESHIPQVDTYFAYDRIGSVTSDLTTKYKYDGNGNIVEQIDPRGNRIIFAYDLVGNRIGQIDAKGNVTLWYFDGNGNVRKERKVALPIDSLTHANLTPASAKDLLELLRNQNASPDDREKEMTYDKNNRLLQETQLDIDYSSVNQSSGILTVGLKTNVSTKYEYDGKGNIQQQKDATGDTIEFRYDALGNVLLENGKEFTDNDGNRVRLISTKQYDTLGNLIKSAKLGVSSSQDQITKFEYDPAGNLTREIDPLGAPINYYYDLNGNIVLRRQRKTNPSGAVVSVDTEYEYDKLNRQVVTRSLEPNANGTNGYVTHVKYNAFNEIEVKGLNGRDEEFFEYDKAGRVVRTNTGGGVWRVYSYDSNGNLTREQLPSYMSGYQQTVSTEYEYDVNNNLIAKIEGESYSYENASLPRWINTTDDVFEGGSVELSETGDVSATLKIVDTQYFYPNQYYFTWGLDLNLLGIDLKGLGADQIKISVNNGKVEYLDVPITRVSYIPLGNTINNPNISVDVKISVIVGSREIYLTELTDLTRDVTQIRSIDETLQFKGQDPAAQTLELYLYTGETKPANPQILTLKLDSSGNPLPGWFEANVQEFAIYGSFPPTYRFEYETKDSAGAVLETVRGTWKPGKMVYYQEKYYPNGTGKPEIIKEKYEYNAFGEMIERQDAKQNATNYTYNKLGTLTREESPLVEVTLLQNYGSYYLSSTPEEIRPTKAYYYDQEGCVIATLEPSENQNYTGGSLVHTSRMIYDEAGNLIKTFNPEGASRTYAYDVFGNKVLEMDELFNVKTYGFDKKNQLTEAKQRYNETHIQFLGSTYDYVASHYGYDEFGRRISHRDDSGHVGLLGVGSFAATGDTEYTYYDDLGRISKTVSYAGVENLYGYTYNHATGEMIKSSSLTMLEDTTNYFGRLISHRDGWGHQTNYVYNAMGWLIGQTRFGDSSPQQDIEYKYNVDGTLKTIIDKMPTAVFGAGIQYVSGKRVTRFEYDVNGNRTFEGYAIDSGNGFVYYQQTTATYDSLNRLESLSDPEFTINYEYDANGNRRRIQASYFGSSPYQQDNWYDYDRNNRMVMAQWESNDQGQIIQGTNGKTITYYDNGLRSTVNNERYTYDAAGRLENVYIKDDLGVEALRATRHYDRSGNVTLYEEFDSSGFKTRDVTSTYTKDNLVYTEVTNTHKRYDWIFGGYKYENTSQSSTYRYNYAGILQAVLGIQKGARTHTLYRYETWDTPKQKEIRIDGTLTAYSTSAAWKPGMSKFSYDSNGHLIAVEDVAGGRQLTYQVDQDGKILQRTETQGTDRSHSQRYYYFNGVGVGDAGDYGNTQNDYAQLLASRNQKPSKKINPVTSVGFDYSFASITDSYPATTPGTYTVQEGDIAATLSQTLSNIALSIWGDSSLWYLLADANGLIEGTDTLVEGQNIVIPNTVTNVHNNSTTFKVYNPAELYGNVSPTLPDPPPPPKRDDDCAQAVVIIVTVAVAIAAPYALGVVGTGFAAGFTAGFVGGFAGSLAGQFTASQLGLQDGVDVGAAIKNGFKSGITAGIVEGLELNVGGYSWVDAAVQSFVTETIDTALGGPEAKWTWKDVAAGAVANKINAEYADAANHGGVTSNQYTSIGFTFTGFRNDFTIALAAGATSSAIRNFGMKDNQIQWSAVAADALGSAIGHAIAAGPRIQMQQANQASKDNFEAAGIPYSTDWRGRPVEVDGPPKPAHLMPGYGLDYDMADDGFFDEQGNEAILAQMERDDAAFARAYKNPNVPGMGSADSLFPESRFSGLKPYESDYRGTPIGFDPNVEAAKFNAGLDAMRAAQQATRPSQFNDGLGMMTSPSMQEIAAVMSSSPAIAKELYGLSPNADIDPAKLQMNHFPLDNSGRIAQQKVTNGIMSFLLGASNERDFFDEGVPGFSPVPGAMSSTPIIEELFAGAVVASGKLAAGGLAATMRGTGSLFGRDGVANTATSEARYVFDARIGRYRDVENGQFVAARDLPWPANAGFESSARQTVEVGKVVDRYGNPSGRFLGEPGSTISQRGMASGSESMPYTQYQVIKPFEAQVGPAAAVPQFGASGGATQYLPSRTIQQLIDDGYLKVVK